MWNSAGAAFPSTARADSDSGETDRIARSKSAYQTPRQTVQIRRKAKLIKNRSVGCSTQASTYFPQIDSLFSSYNLNYLSGDDMMR